ncbi:hypothetical protein DEI92_01595 [Curtobacterium sp. MCBD17_034]|uniref:hypothetical protein n=1 Tax=unclassified Curtobacterium TaxID=257496 RepID=UPI000DAA717A|nr:MULTISPECIES: hypothetical protein [unclassified Curtobacterium]PZF62221.1 hypothetical protein DEI92_01595 [Curtobacterium sp. MCBD17_034]PZM33034.1 hypothetical protein DEI90_15120 [Curtobacterium sp. MCBD17_031]
MTLQAIGNIALGLALVAFLMYRQTTWRRVDPTRVWRMPVVLAGVGVLSLTHSGVARVGTVDVALLVVELVLSAAVGAVMGTMTRFRTVDADRPGRPSSLEARSGWTGAALWLVLVLVRVGIDVLGSQLGAVLLTSTGVVLLGIAANRAARAFVIDRRIPRGPLVRA